ncbi:MAG: hypothetical protein KJ000_34820 [Pirellulaceae bacterium]|nr:hypothetical protein [Pirellulaceae bacterium]
MQRISFGSSAAFATAESGKVRKIVAASHGGGRLWWCLLLGAACIGCGTKSKEMPVVPVSGQMFVQSRPAEGALVVLHPLGDLANGDWSLGYPRGSVSADGSFRISTYRSDDGAPEGQYRVLVSWTQQAEGSETGDPEDETPDLLQERYCDPERSTLEATVNGPSTELPKFDLK